MSGRTGNAILDKAHELDFLLCNHAPVEQINQFLCENRERLTGLFNSIQCVNDLLAPGLIAGLEYGYVREICRYLENRSEGEYYSKLLYSSSMIASNQLDSRKKALFWHVLAEAKYPFVGRPEIFLSRDIFMDNECARASLCFHQKSGRKYDFIRCTMLDARGYIPTDEVRKAIVSDHVSVFEMDRQLHGKGIHNSMLAFLLLHHAVKCFLYLLSHFPEKVCRIRTAEEWLFTVCRCSSADMAIPIIQAIEQYRPGIVANARDPWGNTLLWNTLQNRNPTEELQKYLISHGCDPDASNQWGLSFTIIKENTL